ncbi:MAG: Sapep family Mn(2+)-dependent dipeptidase, partial [Clostridia bacterium]|nr:Sapep family Mn(2+)-dependent dipeptidase [Clostridia bacterium]
MNEYLEQVVESICESVRFDSSRGDKKPNAPFGQGALDCLEHFLALAARMGFETHNYDGYVGEVIFGDGEEEFAILAHLDVVPAGNGWTKDPFGGVVEDGRIWGRGTVDDKGPAICCLYCLKSLKDQGFVPGKKIKLIVGCNEESGWACIDHYKKVATLPETGFSPDAEFPVIYSEKGILQVRFHFPVEHPPFTFLEGGKSINMVCDYCEATPVTLSHSRAQALGLEVKGKKIISRGKSAHASTPEHGKNAILPLLKYFEKKDKTVQHIIDCLFNDVYKLQDVHDSVDKLSVSPDTIKYRKGEIQLVCDIRYPASFNERRVYDMIDSFGVKYETVSSQAPIRVGKNSELVTTLLDVYRECTGREEYPVSIGGGTY